MKLIDYVEALEDRDQRAKVLQALDDAKHLPVEESILDGIESRYGDGTDVVDLETWIQDALRDHASSDEFDALMHAAWLLWIRLAFKPVETEHGLRYVRIDKTQ